jgi:hypothetical protein
MICAVSSDVPKISFYFKVIVLVFPFAETVAVRSQLPFPKSIVRVGFDPGVKLMVP